MPSLSEDLAFRGLIHQVTDAEILARLDRGGVTGYIGFDPTAPSLHVGNLVQLVTLRRLQLAGNRPIVVAGGGTGLIGDPGGRADERQLLTEAEVGANIAAVREQLVRYLDFDPAAGDRTAVLVDNATWLTTLTVTDFLREVGKHFTVSQMIAKESVRSRLDRVDGGISYAEFSYMLLQAYDFYRLHVEYGCDLQLGGSDQWGNITLAIELVKKLTGDQAYGLTTPLLTRADGTKLGKSTLTDEWVWLDRQRTSPFQLYQYFVNLDDDAVGTSLRMLTFLDHEEITALEGTLATDPAGRVAQRRLALAVVAFVHSEAEAAAAAATSEALFDESIFDLDRPTLEAVTADAPSTIVGRASIVGGITVVELLVTTGMCASNGEARRAIDQGGVYLNNRRVAEVDASVGEADLLHGRYVLLRRGKRRPHLVVAG
ncbi:MAG TPA: tyrosine--tRNA ligase [Acidimicrobiales bacterium]|jgi:tyrosyl-tRNA synthetase|nr:tyrosine--tRNA ligase [Acidimicrobiales bacterium]